MGKVPYTFPVSVPQDSSENYRQELDHDGSIQKIVVFFPKNTRTDLQLTLGVDGDPINEAEATDESASIPDYFVGSGIRYDFDVSIQVFEGQDLTIDADNISTRSELDAFVAFSVETEEEVFG